VWGLVPLKIVSRKLRTSIKLLRTIKTINLSLYNNNHKGPRNSHLTKLLPNILNRGRAFLRLPRTQIRGSSGMLLQLYRGHNLLDIQLHYWSSRRMGGLRPVPANRNREHKVLKEALRRYPKI